MSTIIIFCLLSCVAIVGTHAQIKINSPIDTLINRHIVLHAMLDSLDYYFAKYKQSRNDTSINAQVKAQRIKVKKSLGDYIVKNCTDTLAWYVLADFTRYYCSNNISWGKGKLDSVDITLSLKVQDAITCAEKQNVSCNMVLRVLGNTSFLLSKFYSDSHNYFNSFQVLCKADTFAYFTSSCADAIPIDESERYSIKQDIAVKTGIDSIQSRYILNNWLFPKEHYSDTLVKIVRNKLRGKKQIGLVADSALKSLRPLFNKFKIAEVCGVEFDFLGRSYVLIRFNQFGSEEVFMFPFYNPRYLSDLTPNQLDIDYYKELFKNSEYYKVLVGE